MNLSIPFKKSENVVAAALRMAAYKHQYKLWFDFGEGCYILKAFTWEGYKDAHYVAFNSDAYLGNWDQARGVQAA